MKVNLPKIKRNLATGVCVSLLCLSAMYCARRHLSSASIARVSSYYPTNPLLVGLSANPFVRVNISIPTTATAQSFQSVKCAVNQKAIESIYKIDLYSAAEVFSASSLLATVYPSSAQFNIPFSLTVQSGTSQNLWISVVLKEDAAIDNKIELQALKLSNSAGGTLEIQETNFNHTKRIGAAIQKANEGGVNTFRIPGLITTDKGTLVAVYDVRYNSPDDLPARIDVGMKRSTNGGQTWEPMRIILSMGTTAMNGVGDPSILFDPSTKTIWMASLWAASGRSIKLSKPGLSPQESAQYVLINSKDDGMTWSAPFNITSQVKDSATKILFQGPGRGITMRDGTLVFPSQYWDANNTPYSTLIYSVDQGITWTRGKTGAKPGTTESQIIETTGGTLMLNMRDNVGRFRSVATTTDLGISWVMHERSKNKLPDPVCQGSFIKEKVMLNGAAREVLFFSNPNVSLPPRSHITVKASLDLGETWLAVDELLIDERECYGYSCLTRIDDNTLGLLYEGIKDLYFVKIAINEIIKSVK